jgi:hypothetical protein
MQSVAFCDIAITSLSKSGCRWNYKDEADVEQVNAGFDAHAVCPAALSTTQPMVAHMMHRCRPLPVLTVYHCSSCKLAYRMHVSLQAGNVSLSEDQKCFVFLSRALDSNHSFCATCAN